MDNNKRIAIKNAVYEKYNGQCAYCGHYLEDSFHVDHFIPKRRYKRDDCLPFHRNFKKEAGGDNFENLMPSCPSCNSCKSDLSIEEFRDRIYDRVNRVKLYSEFNIAHRYGLIIESNIRIVFHYENFI